YDAQNDPSLATQRLSEMKADGCIACLEIACAGHMAPAIAEWCAVNQFPVIHTCNTATAFTIESSSPYMFHCSVNAWGMAKVLAMNAVAKEGKSTFVYVGVDEACCLDAEKFLEREGKKYNPDCEELASYRVSWEDSEFSVIISTILSMNPMPSMILQQGGGTNFVNIVQQANMYDAFQYFDIYNDLAVDTGSCQDLALAGEYPYGNIKGYCTMRWWDESTKDFTDGFYAAAERHNATEGLTPGDLSYAAYNCGKVLGMGLTACAAAGDDYTDGNVLTRYIHASEWSDSCGDHYFRDFDNQLTFDSYYVVSADGGEELNHLPIGVECVKYTADEYLPTFEEMDEYAREIGVTDWDISYFWN
ncbi:MAG: ABC transporter substrate-binding protein, partial [Clostridia bacterium]|nr:ABC transporter substrate-binding protein [Clostridia bacterium]